MHLSSLAALLALKLGTVALSPSLIVRQGGVFTGYCTVATNKCIVTNPPGLNIQADCAAGGGLSGSIGRGQHNCTVEGHYCVVPPLSGGVFCDCFADNTCP
ncbi:hypothetical protein B0H63DRAFT_456029 [Podospora didyma]|uniref:Uncharacterized protein n=1 Tax=Podospora didyma TaxID=330526 RepID=A0AAE0N2R3_9PEZI|nr:hypothetical protein B0H63DRAFT_456029 [Podospora didyma]